ncbi:RNA polymerase sigma factor ShbA [Amycolatopsis sp. CA-230715]|uniref:RNA polymerase sigma factor ShbA n=1 Tax=Amycolatopsis sp. CA-230715 TaxID=2745196 RepID=UPI001C0161D0|nr:RNA polymerase sigma factor ShbA [Amycolatopsis sp. CA-230715]QWF78261.1 ECF RNA polymerase sigma factor SigD [Amycolatopsis sp. CA-230715]
MTAARTRISSAHSAEAGSADLALPGFTQPVTHPRAGQRLTKEQLDPLVEDAAAENPGAVQALLELIRPMVARYCRARMGGRDLSYLSADDVAQEVCLAVLKALPTYQDRGGSFLYLVHAIAANKVADAYRLVSRDRSDPVPELPEQPLADNEPETHALRTDLGSRLNRLLGRLPQTQQEILALRIAVGLSAVETAEALGISPGNVRVTQHRALTRLRAMVNADEEF